MDSCNTLLEGGRVCDLVQSFGFELESYVPDAVFLHAIPDFVEKALVVGRVMQHPVSAERDEVTR